MPARDANNATWYVLRYERDFVPGSADPAAPWRSPILGKELFYDRRRHVLELLPSMTDTDVEPLSGLAVDVDGDVYRVDAAGGTVRVIRCDGSEADLVCERGVFGEPAGLALDRRGLLYVADPLARRVCVVSPDDGSIVGVLVQGLVEPVDVAVAPDGRIDVADRAAGLIVQFNPRFERCHDFTPHVSNRPGKPKPIAVMIDADGSILVADAAHPRLLRFDGRGRALAEVELAATVGGVTDNSLALSALRRAYGVGIPRFFAGTCRAPRPPRDGGERLAHVHRALRLLRLRLAREFQACGAFVSAVLDAGAPGVQWHRIEIDADLPAGTWIKVQAATSEREKDLSDPATLDAQRLFQPPEDTSSCAVRPFAPSDVPDRLVHAPPGRYLRLRLILGSDGTATPSVRTVRVFQPRVSYLDLLPRVYRRDPESALFLEHFLALFEHVLVGVEDRYELFSRQLNPDAAPQDVIDWLACLIDLAFDPSWPLERRRALVAAAMELYRMRGTIAGIERYVEVYTGVRPRVVEGFQERPIRPSFLGVPGSVLGWATALMAPSAFATPDETLWRLYAHRFTVFVYLEDECDREVALRVVDTIVEANKPAHTVHVLRPVYTGGAVGAARLGLDAMLGASEARTTEIGGCAQPGAPGGPAALLGVDSILGRKRPQYTRRELPELS